MASGQKVMVNGVNLHYKLVGNGDHVLLLMPGSLGSAKTDFEHQLNELNHNKFTMIAWDPRGYGNSRPPRRTFPCDYLYRDADDAAALMEVLGFSYYSILGWSDGANSAAIIAARWAKRIHKLVIWGGACFITLKDIEIQGRIRDTSLLNSKSCASYIGVYGIEEFERMWHGAVDIYVEQGRKGNIDIYAKEVEKIRAKTLIIHGNKDALVPKFHAFYLHDHIAGSRLVCWDDGKHNLHNQHPGRFNKLVEGFLLESYSHL